jgi:hypothetical protein
MINNQFISNLRKLNHNINQTNGEIDYLTSCISSIKESNKYVKGYQLVEEVPDKLIEKYHPLVAIIPVIIMIFIIIFFDKNWLHILWSPLVSALISMVFFVIYDVYCRFNSSVKFYKKSLVEILQLEEKMKKLIAEVQQKDNEFGIFVEQNVIPMVHQSGLISLSEINHNLLQYLVNSDFLESILQKEAGKGNLQKIKMNHNEVMYKSLINEPKIKKNYINYD